MRTLRILLLCALALSFACDQVDFVAPDESNLVLTAQPASIDKSGTSTLTVTGTRATGAPLPDDTVVSFRVDGNLGAISPNPVKLQDGRAQATFLAGNRSGAVTITAFSGTTESEAVEIEIGDSRAASLILTANPSSLPLDGGKTRLRAYVFDEDGNPVPGIPVFFETTAGSLSSGGNAINTNASGIASDTLTTVEEADVTASTSTGQTDTLTVTVEEGAAPECDFTVSPAGNIEEDTQVFFFDSSTDADGQPVEFLWQFGDGGSARGRNVSHTYRNPGTYVVQHSVVDDQGFTSICEPQQVIVVEEGASE